LWALLFLTLLTLLTAFTSWQAYMKFKQAQPPPEFAIWLKYVAILNFILTPLFLLGVAFIAAIRAGAFLPK